MFGFVREREGASQRERERERESELKRVKGCLLKIWAVFISTSVANLIKPLRS